MPRPWASRRPSPFSSPTIFAVFGSSARIRVRVAATGSGVASPISTIAWISSW
ncbi:hypothetical protein [Microbispora sp. H10836]|uniref:hypothetical protein n=1 Tax=Microbispora sp. H10836 TaxID=2729106 RepID=UPI001B8B39D5|nr:hypothetical protein [Microbispora sp. H10836]